VVDRFRERTGERPSVDKESPDLALRVHLVRDRCALLLDTTGSSLHKRGWRRFQGPAPLAETLAAGLLFLSGWDRRSPLLDPFCGSGTILVEAALLAAGRPPGAFRGAFAFERWPGHDAGPFASLRAELSLPRPLPPKLVLRGSDADARQIEGARENLAAAGVEDGVELEVKPARDFAPRKGWNGWIVTNPPYGERVGDARALQTLYRDFGARLREHAPGYHLALLTGGEQGGEPLADALDLLELERRPLLNGALKCVLLTGEIAGTSGQLP
jgi:putative N6-adenine-specific DNA methylase